MSKILGIDLSLNHAGFVQLNERAEIDRYLVVTDVQGAARSAPKGRGLFLGKVKAEDRQAVQMARLMWWEAFLSKLLDEWEPTHVVVEDYAMRADSNAAYNIGEQGGLIRLVALRHGCFLRLHDPMSVKMFGADNGTATGREVADVATARWKLDFANCNPPPAPRGQNTVPEEDLCAAYVLARMGWTEHQVRSGALALNTLESKQIQVFNRVTKANPVNLLGREWLHLDSIPTP